MPKKRQSSPSRRKKQQEDSTDYSGVVSRIKSVDENLLEKVTALFWGRTGTGKTTLIGTFPKPLLILDMREEGTDSILDLGEEVKVLNVNKWIEIEQVYWYLKEGNHPFKTVALDTVSQAQNMCLSDVMEKGGKKPGELVSRGVWGTIANNMKYWLLEYRDLPMNVVFTAHDRVNEVEEVEEDEQIVPEVGPQVIPSVAKTLTGAVKIIGHTFIKEVTKKTDDGLEVSEEYRLRISPHPVYQSRIRKPKDAYAPDSIKDPSYDKLVKIMKGEYQPPKKKTKKKKEE